MAIFTCNHEPPDDSSVVAAQAQSNPILSDVLSTNPISIISDENKPDFTQQFNLPHLFNLNKRTSIGLSFSHVVNPPSYKELVTSNKPLLFIGTAEVCLKVCILPDVSSFHNTIN